MQSDKGLFQCDSLVQSISNLSTSFLQFEYMFRTFHPFVFQYSPMCCSKWISFENFRADECSWLLFFTLYTKNYLSFLPFEKSFWESSARFTYYGESFERSKFLLKFWLKMSFHLKWILNFVNDVYHPAWTTLLCIIVLRFVRIWKSYKTIFRNNISSDSMVIDISVTNLNQEWKSEV